MHLQSSILVHVFLTSTIVISSVVSITDLNFPLQSSPCAINPKYHPRNVRCPPYVQHTPIPNSGFIRRLKRIARDLQIRSEIISPDFENIERNLKTSDGHLRRFRRWQNPDRMSSSDGESFEASTVKVSMVMYKQNTDGEFSMMKIKLERETKDDRIYFPDAANEDDTIEHQINVPDLPGFSKLNPTSISNPRILHNNEQQLQQDSGIASAHYQNHDNGLHDVILNPVLKNDTIPLPSSLTHDDRDVSDPSQIRDSLNGRNTEATDYRESLSGDSAIVSMSNPDDSLTHRQYSTADDATVSNPDKGFGKVAPLLNNADAPSHQVQSTKSSEANLSSADRGYVYEDPRSIPGTGYISEDKPGMVMISDSDSIINSGNKDDGVFLPQTASGSSNEDDKQKMTHDGLEETKEETQTTSTTRNPLHRQIIDTIYNDPFYDEKCPPGEKQDSKGRCRPIW